MPGKRRKGSSRRWLDEHFSDDYVKRAQADGFRSRAVYKLKQIDDKYRLLKPGMQVIDLGAAPGAWSQYAAQKVGDQGRVFALDILPMDTLANVDDICGDINDDAVYQQLLTLLAGRSVGLVMSDMAPNMSGMKAVDQPRSMQLVDMALETAKEVLAPGGDFLVKVFNGAGIEDFRRELRSHFGKLITVKPDASRSRSPEVYMLARDKRVV